jgi:hypothetical protein
LALARALHFKHPPEEHVLRSRTRCSLAPPVGKNPGQRAANVYSAGETTYSAQKYCAPVGDALSPFKVRLLGAFLHFSISHDLNALCNPQKKKVYVPLYK